MRFIYVLMFITVLVLFSPNKVLASGYMLLATPSPTPWKTGDLVEMVSKFNILGGAVWIVWGSILIAQNLKDKNGPGLQSGIWQIVGGTMVIAATQLFKKVSEVKDYKEIVEMKLLNDVMKYAVMFVRFGGVLWTLWGVIILAGALKDKTGPQLNSAIWQIVGGFIIIVVSGLFDDVVKLYYK